MNSRRLPEVRITVLKIFLFCVAKSVLEDLKNQKKIKEAILTPDEKATIQNEADIKGTGNQMSMICSKKGQDMIEAQRDSRRQRHIAALKDSQKFIDQFYDDFCERKNEIRERSRIFISASNSEVD